MPVTVDRGHRARRRRASARHRSTRQTVTMRGASSRVDSVSRRSWPAWRSTPAALNVDQDVDLVAVDANGNQVPSVEIDPAARPRARSPSPSELANAHAARRAAAHRRSRRPATASRRSPSSRSSSPSAARRRSCRSCRALQTEPIDVTGRTSDLEARSASRCPSGVTRQRLATRSASCVTIAEETGTRTFGVGVALSGARPATATRVSPDQVNVTLGGPIARARRARRRRSWLPRPTSRDLAVGTHTVQLDVRAACRPGAGRLDPPQVTVTGRATADRLPTSLTAVAVTRLFGTDGIRGVANVDLQPTLAYDLGRATAARLAKARRTACSSARTRAARATCSWRPSSPAPRRWASTSIASASARRRRSRT